MIMVATSMPKEIMSDNTLNVRYDDFTTVSRQKRLDTPSDHEHVFFETALLLWNKLMQDKTSKNPKGTKKDVEALGATMKVKSTDFRYSSSSEITFMDPPGPIRLLGLTVSGLDEEVPMQDSLFESLQDETEDKLASVLDSLESKFGETAVMSGALWQRFHGDNGIRRKRSELKAAVDAQPDQEDGESIDVDVVSTKEANRSTIVDTHPSIEEPKKTVKKDL